MPQSILQKIQLASLHLLEPLSSEVLYQICLQEATNLSDAECGSLFLEKNERLVRVYSTVPLEYRLTPRPGGNTYTAFEEGDIKCISSSTIHKAHPEGNRDFQSYIFIPLLYQRKRLGIITLQSTKSAEYSNEQKNSFKVFGSLAVLALRNIELYEHVQKALQDRELFMSTAAHELKTPLTTIHAYAQITKKKIEKNEQVEAPWVEAILQNSYRLQTLIKDLFSMSQMKMGVFTYSFADLNLQESISHIVSDNSVSFKRKITLKNTFDNREILISGDRDKLVLAFNNIIGNAIKYSQADTEVVVILHKKSAHYVVTVSDQGAGISPEDLPHIFEQSYQGQHKKSKGMGLGMYLCKQIIEAHHGEIQVSSIVGKGTTVDVYFPSEELDA